MQSIAFKLLWICVSMGCVYLASLTVTYLRDNAAKATQVTQAVEARMVAASR